MSDSIAVDAKSNKTPICPHCEREIRKLNARKVGGPLGVRFLYFCDNCRKVLGVSHRKGFWMG
jgi:uncharacterized protein with PIN domain